MAKMPRWYSTTLLSGWVTLLGLRSWQIAVTFETTEDMPDYYGRAEQNRETKSALIHIREDADEETLVHELLHLALDDLHSLADGMIMSLEDGAAWQHLTDQAAERVCNSLARALMTLMMASRRHKRLAKAAATDVAPQARRDERSRRDDEEDAGAET